MNMGDNQPCAIKCHYYDEEQKGFLTLEESTIYDDRKVNRCLICLFVTTNSIPTKFDYIHAYTFRVYPLFSIILEGKEKGFYGLSLLISSNMDYLDNRPESNEAR